MRIPRAVLALTSPALTFLALTSPLGAQPGPSAPLPEGTKVLKDLPYVPGGVEFLGELLLPEGR